MTKRPLQEKKQSNREHHLTWFERDYREMPRKIADDIFALANIHKRLKNHERIMKNIDQNRRENAVAMGVSIKESDEKYSFESELKYLPEVIKAMLETEKKYGIKFGEIRP